MIIVFGIALNKGSMFSIPVRRTTNMHIYLMIHGSMIGFLFRLAILVY